MKFQAVLHYHRCRCCDKDFICREEECPYRASDKEREWVCFYCIDSGKALIDQFVAGIATARLREQIAFSRGKDNAQEDAGTVGAV